MLILMVASYVWIPLQVVSLHKTTDPLSILEQRIEERWTHGLCDSTGSPFIMKGLVKQSRAGGAVDALKIKSPTIFGKLGYRLAPSRSIESEGGYCDPLNVGMIDLPLVGGNDLPQYCLKKESILNFEIILQNNFNNNLSHSIVL